MALSNDLVSQFVKVTKVSQPTKNEKVVYGTVQKNTNYVKIDGTPESDPPTPISTTTVLGEGDRVTIMIKNHTAVVTGNLTSPAARNKDTLSVDKLDAANARIDNLEAANVTIQGTLNANVADIDNLQADNVTIKNTLNANSANITELQADNATIKGRISANEGAIQTLQTNTLTSDQIAAKYATIENLNAQKGRIDILEAGFITADTVAANYATIENLNAQKGRIDTLESTKISAADIEGLYANIDFSNISKATMGQFYANSGLIQNVVVGDSTITGKLVGVTISGDLIEGNTVKAEKLVIKGTDGLYYKLNTDGVTTEAQQTNQNSLDGSVIKAKSITATKVNVTDLVAFDATIGGFNITDSALYSGVKSAANNTTRGIYLGKDAQAALGDGTSYIKYYKDSNGNYKLAISADSMSLTSGTNVQTAITNAQSTADTAKTDAATAQSTANTAKTNAATAQSTADTAKTNAANAQTAANNAKTAADNAQADINTVKTRMTSAETSITQHSEQIALRATKTEVTTAKEEAISAASTDATNKVNAVQVGGRNLVIDSGVEHSNNDYCPAWYTPSSPLVSGETYTATICVTPAEGVNHFALYLSLGYANRANFPVSGTEKQIISKTFTASYVTGRTPSDGADYARVQFYRFPNDNSVTANSTIHWVKIEKGNKATDWSPAPEDVNSSIADAKKAGTDAQSNVNALAVRVTAAETSITQNANALALRATKTEVSTAKSEAISAASTDATNKINAIQIGGRNILLNSRFDKNAEGWTSGSNITDYVTKYNRKCAHFKHTALKATKDVYQSVLNKLEPNTTYTMSGWVLTENIVLGTTNPTYMFYHSGTYDNNGTSTWFGYGSKAMPINTGTGSWTRLTWTFTTDDKVKTATNTGMSIHTRDLTGDIYFCDLKLEKGNKATDWTPAPEDAESEISSLDTRVSSAESSITILANSIASNVTETTNLGTRTTTLEQTADGLTARIDTAESDISTAKSNISTVTTTANTAKTTANTALSRTTVKDTRETNETPAWYMTNHPKQTVVEFKKCSAIGLSGDTYCSLETIVPWGDKSGSYPKQTATVKEKQYWRTGSSDTAWGAWIAASETATNFLSFDTTNGVLIGNKTSGSWSGTRAQITGSAFKILDSDGTILSSYGAATTIGKDSGNNILIKSTGIFIRNKTENLAIIDQYGLKIPNTNDATGSLGSGTTKPALVIGTPTAYHIEMDNNEIMAKSDATTSSHLFLNMEGGNVSVNNNANRAFMFQEGALYAKNSSFNNGEYLGILDALNDAGNTTLGYGGYLKKIGGTNIYGDEISLFSNGNVSVEASWINCRSIAPNDHATYALGVYGEKGWSNIYLGKGDGKTNALHIISGSSTYTLCGVNSSGQYIFGNNAAVMYYQVKNVNETTTGNAFKVTSGNNTAANNTSSVWFFGAADETSRYIGSYLAYNRTYSSAANMVVTANGIFGRSTSSSKRYKEDISVADINELKGLYDLPVKKFKYKNDYIASDDELYNKHLYGFIVEDLENVLPCAVQHKEDEDGKMIPEMWNSNVIVPSLLKLIQDLNNRLKILEQKGA